MRSACWKAPYNGLYLQKLYLKCSSLFSKWDAHYVGNLLCALFSFSFLRKSTWSLNMRKSVLLNAYTARCLILLYVYRSPLPSIYKFHTCSFTYP